MTDDLVTRLRDKYASPQDIAQAADRIEKLEAANLRQSCIKVDDEMRIEKLERALAHIYAWYPISVSGPIQTIHEIRDYARKALEGKDD